MAAPTTREGFKEYCLRKLGKPVVEINVDDDQVEDRIDEAISYYIDYHFDGSETYYLKHQVTANNVANGYIEVDEGIKAVIKIFDIGQSVSSNEYMFDARYQIALQDIWALTSIDLAPYYIARTQLEQVRNILIGRPLIRFNRHTDRLYLDIDWQKLKVGSWIVFECYKALDQDDYDDIWSDRWLQNYATQLIKQQWGTNLKKFSGMTMPGQVQFNGQQIYDEATNMLAALEREMITTYSLPTIDMVG